jgi:hypothetical protein
MDLSNISPILYGLGVLITVIGSFIVGRKNGKPGLRGLFAALRERFIDYTLIDQTVDTLLQKVGVPSAWAAWASGVVAKLFTTIPAFAGAGEDQQTDVLASVFSTGMSADQAADVTGVEVGLLKQSFVRKRVAKRIATVWNHEVPGTTAIRKIGSTV